MHSSVYFCKCPHSQWLKFNTVNVHIVNGQWLKFNTVNVHIVLTSISLYVKGMVALDGTVYTR